MLFKFFRKIKYIIKWLPVLWQDECWDWTYILSILQFKIKCQREYIGYWDRHTTAQQDCKHMRTIELLLQRMQDPHKYVEEEWQEHRNKYPLEWKEKDPNDDFVTMKALPEQATKEIKKLMEKEEYMWQQDFKLFTKLMRKHLRKFWD